MRRSDRDARRLRRPRVLAGKGFPSVPDDCRRQLTARHTLSTRRRGARTRSRTPMSVGVCSLPNDEFRTQAMKIMRFFLCAVTATRHPSSSRQSVIGIHRATASGRSRAKSITATESQTHIRRSRSHSRRLQRIVSHPLELLEVGDQSRSGPAAAAQRRARLLARRADVFALQARPSTRSSPAPRRGRDRANGHSQALPQGRPRSRRSCTPSSPTAWR